MGGDTFDKFQLVSNYRPTGDQPQAIQQLVEGLNTGMKEQTLLGVTGSGKTFTMANVIAQVNRPTLVLAHNKTLAAQLCSEFREFFPNNAVEYFVSYYDYYQPEAYIPQTDTYIEKDSAINDEIDKLRHSATSALSERRDVIIVASVSCIYSLGDPIDYRTMVISLRPGQERDRDELLKKLVELQYEGNEAEETIVAVPTVPDLSGCGDPTYYRRSEILKAYRNKYPTDAFIIYPDRKSYLGINAYDWLDDESLYVYVSQDAELAAFTDFFMNRFAKK